MLLLLGAVSAALAQAPALQAPALQAPALQAPLTLNGAGPFYRLTLPTAIYGHAAFDDLRDLRVRNAAGQAVPFAWLDRDAEAPAATIQTEQVPIFAVPSAAAGPGQSTGAVLGLRLRSDGSLTLGSGDAASAAAAGASEWLIDASRLSGDLIRATFAIAPGPQGIFPFALDTSDDLRRWRPLVANEPLVRLDQSAQRIERLALELDPVRARYLRLRWLDPVHAPTLTGVSLDSTRSAPIAAPALVWSADVPASSCAKDYCDYPAPRGLPVESLRIALAQPNTLAAVRLSSLATNTEAPRTAPRNPLFVLRHGQRRRADARSAAGEWPLLDTVLYRLDQPGGVELRSPALALDGSVHAVLRLRTDGAVSALGRTPPLLSFGARPRALVFLAQGGAPYTLRWSAPGSAGAVAIDAAHALPLAMLMPNQRVDKPLAADSASVTLPPASVTAASLAGPGRVSNSATMASKTPWLWAALGVGLMLLAGMAWSLLRSLRTAARPLEDKTAA